MEVEKWSAEDERRVPEIKPAAPSSAPRIAGIAVRCLALALLLVPILASIVVLAMGKTAYWPAMSLTLGLPAAVLAALNIYISLREAEDERVLGRQIFCLVGGLLSGALGLGSIWVGVLLSREKAGDLDPPWPAAWLCFFAGSVSVVSAGCLFADYHNFCARVDEDVDVEPPPLNVVQGLRWAVMGVLLAFLTAATVLLATFANKCTRIVFSVTHGLGIVAAGLAVLNLVLDNKRRKLKIGISIFGGLILVCFIMTDMVVYSIDPQKCDNQSTASSNDKTAVEEEKKIVRHGFYLFVFLLLPAFFAAAGFFLAASCNPQADREKKERTSIYRKRGQGVSVPSPGDEKDPVDTGKKENMEEKEKEDMKPEKESMKSGKESKKSGKKSKKSMKPEDKMPKLPSSRHHSSKTRKSTAATPTPLSDSSALSDCPTPHTQYPAASP